MSIEIADSKVVRGACPQDCPDTCAFLYTVKDDKLISVVGDPDHPVTRGGLCVKLKDFANHHYNPDRVLYPMKRSGPKGSGQFTRISWDAALAEIRERWTSIIDQHGSESILPYSYLGNQGILNGFTAGDAFFNRLGTCISEKTFCGSGAATAYMMTVGPTGGVDPESFAHSKYIVLWGANPVSTNLHLWPFILEAQKKGAKIVVIDPVRSRTAKQADWHIAPRPGTDAALALGVMNVILAEGLQDDDYIAKYTVGIDDLAKRALDYSPEVVEGITGIAADDIRRFAREYAGTQPAVIRYGVALERNRNGGQSVRAVCCLPALVGAWRHPGGGILGLTLWNFPVNFEKISRPDWIKSDKPRVINVMKLGETLAPQAKQPIKSAFFYNVNPASQSPQQGRIVEGLKREDLFTVVSELFVTDTARYADIILPATMQAEQLDLMFSWGHNYLSLNSPAIPPSGEAVPNTELFRRLAKTMGFTDPEWERTDEEMMRDCIDWESPVMQGVTYEALKQHGYQRLNVGPPATRAPHAEGNFPTPTGKCELRTTQAENGNWVVPAFRHSYDKQQPGTYFDPVPEYLPMFESPTSTPELAAKYPLNILTPKSHGFLNSMYANVKTQLRRQGDQRILIHPLDADTRHITTGAEVRVFNDRGHFVGQAEVTTDVLPGVVYAALGYWPSLSRSGSAVNAISSDALGNTGGAPTFSDNLVQVEAI